MAIHARTLVAAGVRRVTSPVGAGLFVTFVLALVAFNAAVNTVLTAVAGTELPFGVVVAEYAVVVPVHPALAALLALVTLPLTAFCVVVGSRLLLGDAAPRWSNPLECLTHRIVPATFGVLVGSLVVALVVAVGTALLVVPGVVLAGHLLLVSSVLAAEDKGVLAACRESWTRASGDRLELVTATLALVVPAALIVVVMSFTYVLPPLVEFALGCLLGAALLSLWLGVATEAYSQVSSTSKRRARTSRNRRASRAL